MILSRIFSAIMKLYYPKQNKILERFYEDAIQIQDSLFQCSFTFNIKQPCSVLASINANSLPQFIIEERALNQQRLFHQMSSYSVGFPRLTSYRSIHDEQHFLSVVDRMYAHYHCPVLNELEDHIDFHEKSEYLKRFYKAEQFKHKITVIGEYYQYHQELPRMFLKEIYPIIQTFNEDIRSLQYKFVKKKIHEDEKMQGRPPQGQKAHRPVDKIIRSIELSYYNFQQKHCKKDKNHPKTHNGKATGLTKNKKSIPTLTIHHHQQKVHPESSLKTTSRLPIPVLTCKDTHRSAQHSKAKDPSKKLSANNSIETPPKSLSRAKSKLNLATIKPGSCKRPSVSNLQKIDKKPAIVSKPKSTAGCMQRAESKRDIRDRRALQQRKNIAIQQNTELAKKEAGVKNMFRKAMETKKMIKISN